MTDRYNEVYDIIINMAKTKMAMNSHKGRIEDVPLDDLVTKGIMEFEELRAAIEDKNNNYLGVIEEVADILNFAMAAAYHAIEDYRSRK